MTANLTPAEALEASARERLLSAATAPLGTDGLGEVRVRVADLRTLLFSAPPEPDVEAVRVKLSASRRLQTRIALSSPPSVKRGRCAMSDVQDLIAFIRHNRQWERLQDADRACYDEAAEVLEAQAAEIERLRAEAARLREALADLLSWFPDHPEPSTWRLLAGKQGADDAIAHARAALGGKP